MLTERNIWLRVLSMILTLALLISCVPNQVYAMAGEALADLLTEKPLDKITVTDVVTRANINRGTFYAHYRDIPDVVDHLIQQTFSAIRDAMISHPATDANIEHTLICLFTISSSIPAPGPLCRGSWWR